MILPEWGATTSASEHSFIPDILRSLYFNPLENLQNGILTFVFTLSQSLEIVLQS